MQTLAFDCQRCRPTQVAEKCKTCARWADHPEQVWGPRTPVAPATPDGEGCSYIPEDDQT